MEHLREDINRIRLIIPIIRIEYELFVCVSRIVYEPIAPACSVDLSMLVFDFDCLCITRLIANFYLEKTKEICDDWQYDIARFDGLHIP